MSRSTEPPVGRRRFLKIVGIAGLSSALPGPILAQTPAGKPPITPQPVAPPKQEADTGPSDDAKALAEIVKRRYGQHLTPEQLQAVTKQLDERLQAGKRLRDSKLANADEPDATF